MRKRIIHVFLLLVLVISTASGIQIDTDFTEDKYYRTTGTFETDASFDMIRVVLTDFPSYRRWAVKGLGGTEPGTEDFIGLLKDTEYNPEENTLDIIYDVRLPWPFGSTGNRATFLIKELDTTKSYFSFALVMTDTSAVLKDASLRVRVYNEQKGRRIESTAKVRFTFILNLFFNLPGYRKTIEWRIVRVMSNMEDYIDSFPPAESRKPEVNGVSPGPVLR